MMTAYVESRREKGLCVAAFRADLHADSFSCSTFRFRVGVSIAAQK